LSIESTGWLVIDQWQEGAVLQLIIQKRLVVLYL